MERDRSLDMGWWARSAAAVLAHPGLWLSALGAYKRMLPNDWYSERPYLPVPAREYVEFRMHTLSAEGRPSSAELIRYLVWLKAWPDSAGL